MILLLSDDCLDQSTDDIIDWINYLKGSYVRVNSQDFIDKMSISINLNNKNQSSYKYGDIDFREINVVWFWRWNHYDFSYTRKLGKDNFKIAHI